MKQALAATHCGPGPIPVSLKRPANVCTRPWPVHHGPPRLIVMDPTSAVRTDALPAIATLVGPGLAATTPYTWFWLGDAPAVLAFLNQHEAIAVTAAVLLWVIRGFAIDSLGSYVEVYCIDRRRPNHDEMLKDWWRYLRIGWVHEPVGQHYLRRLLTSFKFELNMSVAAWVSLVGVGVLGVGGQLQWPLALFIVVALGTLALLLAKAARDSSDVLAKVRAELVKGVGEPPFGGDGNPAARRSA